MPWLSILMAILSFLSARKGDSSNNAKAALIGTAAGLGTYYVTHDTAWGTENLGSLDGVTEDEIVRDDDGNVVGATSGFTDESITTVTPSGGTKTTTIKVPSESSTTSTIGAGQTSGLSKTLAALTPSAGTVAAVGAGAVLGGSDFFDKYGLWIVGGVIALLVMK